MPSVPSSGENGGCGLDLRQASLPGRVLQRTAHPLGAGKSNRGLRNPGQYRARGWAKGDQIPWRQVTDLGLSWLKPFCVCFSGGGTRHFGREATTSLKVSSQAFFRNLLQECCGRGLWFGYDSLRANSTDSPLVLWGGVQP